MKALLSTRAIVLVSSPVLAATAGVRSDHSGLLVWIFLGFCGLVIVAQLIPAIMVLFGIAKGISESEKTICTH